MAIRISSIDELEIALRPKLLELTNQLADKVYKTLNFYLKEEDSAMYADDTMSRIMGADPNLSPEECYWFWYNRVKEDCRNYVNDTVARCISGEGTIQIQYIWEHPELGEIEVYCAATCAEKIDGVVYLEGYHRIASNIEMSSFKTEANAIK